MIVRAADLASSAAWTRAADAPSRIGPLAALAPFEGTCAIGAPIRADAGSGARGLSVAQHADRVLAFLRGDAGQSGLR